MTKLYQVVWQVRALVQRVQILEAGLGAIATKLPNGRPKHTAAPRPDNAVIDEGNALWAAYLVAEMEHGHGRTRKLTKAYFAMKHNIPLSEFYRLFSYHDKRGIPPGSAPFLRMEAHWSPPPTNSKIPMGRVAVPWRSATTKGMGQER